MGLGVDPGLLLKPMLPHSFLNLYYPSPYPSPQPPLDPANATAGKHACTEITCNPCLPTPANAAAHKHACAIACKALGQVADCVGGCSTWKMLWFFSPTGLVTNLFASCCCCDTVPVTAKAVSLSQAQRACRQGLVSSQMCCIALPPLSDVTCRSQQSKQYTC